MCHRMLAALAAFTVLTASAAPLNDTIIEGVIPTLPPTIAQKQLETGCAAPCSKHLMETLRTLMKPGNNSLLMDEACQQYDDARECMQRLPHCSSGRAFEVVTSGLQFMCVDQRDAFNAVIDCVDENSDSVHGECEASCRVNSALAAFSMKDALTQGFGAIKKAIDANMIRMVMNEGCRISQCLLKCHKVKFNARCQGSAGTLLAEVFVRPFALGSRSMSPMNSLLRLFVPDKCAYLLDPASLQELRIDPELEAELRRMYSQPKSSVDVAPAKADIGVSSQVVNGLVEGLSNNVGHTRTEVIKMNKAKVTTQDAKGVKIEGGKVEGSVITRRLEDLQEVEDGSEIAWTEGSSSGGDITEASASGDVELFSGEFSGEGTGDGSGEDLLDYQEHSGEARGDSIPQIDPKTGDRVLKMTRMKDGSADLFLAQRIDPDIPYVLRMLVPQRDRGELVCVLQTDRGFERQVADGRWPLLKDEENH